MEVKFGAEDKISEEILEWLGQEGTDSLLVVVYKDDDEHDASELKEQLESIGCQYISGTELFHVVVTREQLWELAALDEVMEIRLSIQEVEPLDELLESVQKNIDPDLELLDSVDWHDRLTPDEIVDIDGRPCPTLAGLRRLAKPYINREEVKVNYCGTVQREVRRNLKRYEADENGKLVVVGAQEVVGHDNLPYASVTFTIHLDDFRSFTDSADAWLGNCDKLGNYPTAVASSRAEGRVLRKVLGIKEHVAEELSSKDALEELTDPNDSPIAPEQKKLIERLVGQIEGASLKVVFEKVTARDITGLDQLTGGEAVDAIKLLNSMKKKKK